MTRNDDKSCLKHLETARCRRMQVLIPDSLVQNEIETWIPTPLKQWNKVRCRIFSLAPSPPQFPDPKLTDICQRQSERQPIVDGGLHQPARGNINPGWCSQELPWLHGSHCSFLLHCKVSKMMFPTFPNIPANFLQMYPPAIQKTLLPSKMRRSKIGKTIPKSHGLQHFCTLDYSNLGKFGVISPVKTLVQPAICKAIPSCRLLYLDCWRPGKAVT